MPTIIGIDPGSIRTGYGIIHVDSNKQTCVAHGHILTKGDDVSQKLYQIYSKLCELIETHQPQQAAIEQVFMHRNPQSALKLGQARGAAMIALAKYVVPVAEYSAKQIKLAITGYGAASKEQMQHMVTQLLSLKQRPQVDAADALAAAICHCNTQHLANVLARSTISAGEGS